MRSQKRALIGSRVILFILGIPMTLYGIQIIIMAMLGNSDLLATLSIGVVGFILLGAGIANVLAFRYRHARILGALKSYECISIKQLSSEIRLSERKIKKSIAHLRAEGSLKASYDPKTGDILVIEVEGEPPEVFRSKSSIDLPEDTDDYKYKQKPQDHNYCSYCGSIIKPDDKFCNNCGTYLNE